MPTWVSPLAASRFGISIKTSRVHGGVEEVARPGSKLYPTIKAEE
jgi:hypothetical protein